MALAAGAFGAIAFIVIDTLTDEPKTRWKTDFVRVEQALQDATQSGRPFVSVLFIGNSHTYVNNVPLQVQDLSSEIEADSPRIVSAMLAHGGVSLLAHRHNPILAEALDRFKWDVIVIQDRSNAHLYEKTHLEFHEVIDWFKKRTDPSKTRLVLYATWAYRRDIGIYRAEVQSEWSMPQTPSEMNALVAEEYRKAGRRVGASVAPVGTCWLMAEDQDSLYAKDGNHTSRKGARLAAYVLYRTITMAVSGEPQRALDAESDEAFCARIHAAPHDERINL